MNCIGLSVDERRASLFDIYITDFSIFKDGCKKNWTFQSWCGYSCKQGVYSRSEMSTSTHI